MMTVVFSLIRTVIGAVILCTKTADKMIGWGTFVLIVTKTLASVATLYMEAIYDVMNSDSHMEFVFHFLNHSMYVWADSDSYSIKELILRWWSDIHYLQLRTIIYQMSNRLIQFQSNINTFF